MSAFVMHEDEISTIVSYFITPVTDDQLYIEVDDEYKYMGLLDAPRVAKILFDQNVRSVEERYSSIEAHEFRFTFDKLATRRPLGNIIGALDCLEYQSCESDDYEDTDAYKILARMRKHLLKRAAGDDYTWGIQ